MKNIRIKNSIFILIGVSAIIWLLIAYIFNKDLSVAVDFLRILPTVVTVDTIIITIFIKYGWKWKIFKHWLVQIPDVSGSWKGLIYSDWIDPRTNTKIQPIPVMLTVKQYFFQVSCVMHTSEMKSASIAAGFEVDCENQIKKLSYIYTSRPRVSLKERSTIHDGSIIFDIIEKPEKKLSGKYWTERKTTGEVILEFYSNEILEQLPTDFDEHPVTEEDNKR